MKQKNALRGQISLVIIGVVAVVVLGAAGFALRNGTSSGERNGQSDSFQVRRGAFDITLPVSGELAALKQIEVRNNLDGRAIITEIVGEGTWVNTGDVLLRLNDEDIRNRLRDAQDRVNVAEAALISAESSLEIRLKTQRAELDAADVTIKLATLSLSAWREGEAVTQLKELELAVETAEKEFVRLEERFAESATLQQKDFISMDEYKRDEISFIRAKADLSKAQLALEVYKKYQFERDEAEKMSAVDQARSDRERVEKENEAEVRSARSEVDSKKFQLESAKEQLTELQQQLAFCTVTAPAPGLVVYYSSTQQGGGRNDGRPPQVGTELSRNEMVIILPDTSQMVAAVKVSEALVGQIQRGQYATVTCDATPDQVLTGTVQSVGVLAESGGWRDPNRRDYTVRILLNSAAEHGMKPSMRCKASIYVGRVNDSLHVPIQALFRVGPVAYVYVPQGSGFAQRQVSTGLSSELYIEITKGLEEGETVLLRQPEPEEVVSRLPIPEQDSAPSEMEEAPSAMIQGGPMMQENTGEGMRSGGGERPEGGQRRGGPRSGARPEGAPGGAGDGGAKAPAVPASSDTGAAKSETY